MSLKEYDKSSGAWKWSGEHARKVYWEINFITLSFSRNKTKDGQTDTPRDISTNWHPQIQTYLVRSTNKKKEEKKYILHFYYVVAYQMTRNIWIFTTPACRRWTGMRCTKVSYQHLHHNHHHHSSNLRMYLSENIFAQKRSNEGTSPLPRFLALHRRFGEFELNIKIENH